MDKSNPISAIGEKSLIANISGIFNTSKNACIAKGAGEDDCAVIDLNNEEFMVVTTDMLHMKTDFPLQMSAWQIGWMSAAVNFSDIAAMGACPMGLLAAFGLPENMELGFIEDVSQGMNDCAKYCNTSVVGGDIDKHDELTITGTALGRVDKNNLLTRSGAKTGDLVCVTGHTGSAGAALYAIKNNIEVDDEFLKALFEPVPRTHEAQKLAQSGAVTSMIDTSDGLAMSLYDLALSSQVGFRIYEDKLPVSNEIYSIADKKKAIYFALYSSGDFELLFTISSELKSNAVNSCDFSIIGEVIDSEKGIVLERTDKNQEVINRKGYEQL
ncbi:thiamine-monophosphate kinase [Methanohalobium evestigatum Z-7303]|uniref:Thiamine-monophosphate kinase n=1 Tax=Methanohalobium evestigatum (strain ATCC BAA-1072 / DSM 3721 / NBRC 107634 / OCM 161 / Z-7303) TaxID=644295 RepID=D7EBJ3_METEZ|nr:thiamine-phosphate kinase [Methanohalobium evestigatum]ADI74835.1 thiamine-monophosphate kinase [Methanohalobium evestigatum Z-7303]